MSKKASDGVIYLSQDVDYLGFLEAQLRDLHGITTLTYELIQNADDVKDENGRPGTSLISFDVTDEALIVRNDGIFRDVDFDRLRRVASGGKRDEAGTTGAFGIGFISVYQITDYPELFSANRHWTIRPDAEADKRITQLRASTEGTGFRLPWAFNPDSVVRQKLRIPPVNRSALPEIAREIAQAVELAALFLKQLTLLEVKASSLPLKRLERQVSNEDNQVLIQDGEGTLIWQIFEGDFEDAATELRKEHPQIEKKRRSRVRIAIPDEKLPRQGRLFATLPSETTVPLPFHIDADFFPTTDRKRIPFDSGYQGEWNRAAIECAARILADNFSQLPALLGAEGMWQLLSQVNLTRHQAENEDRRELDESFASFWDELGECLEAVPIIYTSTGKWVRAREARLLESDAETAATPVLEALGIPIVHPSLRPYFSLMQQKEIGTPLLTVDDVVRAFQKVKLAEGDLSKAPKPLQEMGDWRLLWAALDSVLDRAKRLGVYPREAERLKQYPIALTTRQQLRTPNHVYWADTETRKILENIPWLHAELSWEKVPGSLVDSFNGKLAIEYLSDIKPEQFAVAWREGRTRSLFQWLDTHRDEFLVEEALVRNLMQIPLFLIDEELYSLDELYLPGGFDDPLNLSLLVDLEAIGGHRAFLEELGVPILDFKTYVSEQVPAILEDQPDLSPDIRFQLVHLIAKRLSEIREDNRLRQRLQQLPLIGCTDGTVRPAAEVYALDRIRALLGANAPIATPPPTETIQDFHRWLGIPNEPRSGDLLAHVKRLTDSPPTSSSIEYIANIFGYLADNWRDWNGQYERVFADLQKRPWLPGKADAAKWFRPTELYAIFQSYLFESQGNFLNLPRPVQDRGARRSGFLDYLGVNAAPSPEQVVRHLLLSATHNKPVNQEVYRFLSDNADDPSLNLLADKPCLLLDRNRYVLPRHVFWGEHPFGRFRHQLSDQLRPFSALFDRLGVRDVPEIVDYIDVLQTVSEEYAPGHLPLEPEARAVVMSCWEALSSALERGDLSAEALRPLSARDVIPDDRDKPLLRRPEQLFFEDRAGLAGRFDGRLDKDVLPRPLRAWRAMQAVGVRFLSQVVAIEFLDKADAVPDRLLVERLRERRPLLQRVIESERADSAEIFASDILDKLHVLHAPGLVIRYRFNAFSRPFYSKPEQVSAIWDGFSRTLYSGGATRDWVGIARELANAVKQAREIGSLAMAFKEILAAERVTDAERLLDDYGYPPLDDKIFVATGSYGVTELGGLKKPSYAEDGDEDEAITSVDDDNEPVSIEPIEDPLAVFQGRPATIRQPSPLQPDSKPERPVYGMGLQPSAIDGDGHRSSPGPDHQARPVEREGKMLISYVYHSGGDASKAGSKTAETRTGTDEAGISRVMAYERAKGRRPEKMPHLNKGYDIYSASPDSEIRYIEVKSLSGYWNRESPARITAAQFEFARQHGEQFWLYVVERAQSDEEFQIYPLQAPTSRIDRYAFDYGWQEFAEDAVGTESQAYADEDEEE